MLRVNDVTGNGSVMIVVLSACMEIPTGFAQVNLIFSGAALPLGAQVAFGVGLTDPVAQDPASVANDVINAWNGSGIKAELSSQTTMSGLLVKFGPNATGPSGLFAGAGANTNAGVCAAPNTTYLVSKNTTMGGRAGRGRMYLPGVPEVNVNEAGVVSTAAITALQTKLATFNTALETNDTPMVLLHCSALFRSLEDKPRRRRGASAQLPYTHPTPRQTGVWLPTVTRTLVRHPPLGSGGASESRSARRALARQPPQASATGLSRPGTPVIRSRSR